MGNNDTFGIGRVKAVIGVFAPLDRIFCIVLNVLVLLSARVRMATARTARAGDHVRHDRPNYDASSIKLRNPHVESVHSALAFTVVRFAEKPKDINLDLIRNRLGNTGRAESLFLKEIINIGFKRNDIFGQRGIFAALGCRALLFRGSSANASSPHGAADGGNYMSRAEGYVIPT